MRSIRPYRVLGRYSLSIVQVGLEERSSRKRNGESARAPEATRNGALSPRPNRSLLFANIFIPEVWMLGNELAHHLNTLCIVKNYNLDSMLAE